MTDIVPVPNWGGVRQLETNEYATGGLNGNMNEQAKSLAGQNMYSRLYAGLPFDPVFTARVGGFPIGGKAALENGDIVLSTVANNIINPNVDMTGWVSSGNILRVSHVDKMLDISNPKNGMAVIVDSYHAPNFGLLMPFSGGGIFIYDSTKSLVNDKGLIVNGWVRVVNQEDVSVDWFGADKTGVSDSTQAVLDAILATTGTLVSAPVSTKAVTISFGDGYYRVGDIPLIGGVTFKGQGRSSTYLFPKAGAEWVFYTTPESYEFNETSGIDAAHRLCHTTIQDMTVGRGYVAKIPTSLTGYSTSAGGIYQQSSSWCKIKNVNIAGVDGIGLKLIGVFDMDVDDLSMFSVGKATNSESIYIDRFPTSNDGSNVIHFRRLHIEGVHKYFYIGRNSRLVYFDNSKFESCEVGSEIVDTQGVVFSNLNLSNSSVAGVFPFVTISDSDGSYSPLSVVFDNLSVNKADWIVNNLSRAEVCINGGSAVQLKTLFTGGNLQLSDFYTFECGPQFITCSASTIRDSYFKSNLIPSGTATDGTKDFIVLVGSDNIIENNKFLSYTTLNVAFIKLDGASVIRNNQFNGTAPYVVRGAEQGNHYDNLFLGTGAPYQFSTEPPKRSLLNRKNGLGAGGISSNVSVTVNPETAADAAGAVLGGSLINCRVTYLGGAYNLLLLADTGSGANKLQIVSHNLPIGVATGNGVAGDGKLYVSNWSTVSSNLTFVNRSANTVTIRTTTLSVVI